MIEIETLPSFEGFASEEDVVTDSSGYHNRIFFSEATGEVRLPMTADNRISDRKVF